MPHCFRIQHRPKAFSFKSSTQENKHKNKPKLPHKYKHILTIWSTKRWRKYTNGKLKTSRIEYLLVGVNNNTKNESKRQPKVAWGSKNRKPSCSLSCEWGGGEFLDAKTFPSLVFYNLGAGVARPGELTCYFFFRGALTMPPPSYGLAFCLLELT